MGMNEDVNCQMCGSCTTTSRCRRCATVLCGECWHEGCLCMQDDSCSDSPETDSMFEDEIAEDDPWNESDDENAEARVIENDVMSDIQVNLQAFILDSTDANGTKTTEFVCENDPLADIVVKFGGSVMDNGIQFQKYCKTGQDFIPADGILETMNKHNMRVPDVVAKTFKWVWCWPLHSPRELVYALAKARIQHDAESEEEYEMVDKIAETTTKIWLDWKDILGQHEEQLG